ATLIAPHIQSTLSYESDDHRILDITIVPPHSPQINIRNVYAPADITIQRPFWSSFPPLPSSLNIIGGDFNAILTATDHVSSTQWKRHPLGSYILPHLNDLIDTGGTGPKPAFTSYHQRENNWSKSRIDYIFTSPTIFLPLPSPQRTWEVTLTTELFYSQMHGKITNPQYGVSMHHSSNPKNTWQPSNKSSSYTPHSNLRNNGMTSKTQSKHTVNKQGKQQNLKDKKALKT